MHEQLNDWDKLSQESAAFSVEAQINQSISWHNTLSKPLTTKTLGGKKKRPPGLLYSSDNIILVLIVVEQMSLWVGLMSRAAETFLFYPPSTFKGIEGAPAR